MKRTVKFFNWVQGVLEWTEHEFASHNEALEFTHKYKHHHHIIKMFNSQGVCIHEVANQPTPPTYA